MIERVELANIKTPSITQEKRVNGKPYVDYGENNLFPQELLFFSNKSTTHAACLELIKLSVAGNGYTCNPEADLFLKSLDYETSNSTLLDKIAVSMSVFGGFALEVIWNVKGDKIAEVHILPLENIRAGHPDRYGYAKEYYYNCLWEINSTSYEVIPAFDPKMSLEQPKQLLYIGLPSNQSIVYPTPSYVTAINYIATEYELSKHYLSAAANSFLPSAMITFIGNPTPEERAMNKRLFEKSFVGTEATSKVILNYVDSIENKAVVETIQTNNAVDHYMNTSTECKMNIITANGITSPALVAISDSNQSIFSNGEELKVSWDIFYNTKIKSYHNLIEKSMDLVLKYAGYPDANYQIIPFTPVTIQPTAPTVQQNIFE